MTSITTHTLKCWPEAFNKKWQGKKNWEFRKADRNFIEDDILIEQEYDPNNQYYVGSNYSGRQIVERVVYIIHGPAFGIPNGYCAMSTEILFKKDKQ